MSGRTQPSGPLAHVSLWLPAASSRARTGRAPHALCLVQVMAAESSAPLVGFLVHCCIAAAETELEAGSEGEGLTRNSQLATRNN